MANLLPDDKQIGGDHYMSLTIQPWAAMESWMTKPAFIGFLVGNVIKYVARYNQKNGIDDLKKAQHYLEKCIETMQKSAEPQSKQTL